MIQHNISYKIGQFLGRIGKDTFALDGYCGQYPFVIGDEFVEAREAPTPEQLTELVTTGFMNREFREAKSILARVIKIMIYGVEFDTASPGIKCEIHIKLIRGNASDLGELVSLVGMSKI